MSEIKDMIRKDPYARFLGIEFQKIEKGYSLCKLRVTEDMMNFAGLVHGGLVFSLADAAFSAASNYDYHPSYALDVSGSFLQSGKIGDTIIAEAALIHTTKRTGVYRLEVHNNGELMATFNGTVFRKV
jgi:acyl-CoA thioesterase